MSPDEFLSEFGRLVETEGGILQMRQLSLALGLSGVFELGNKHDASVEAVVAKLGSGLSSRGTEGIPTGWGWVTMSSVVEQRLGKMLDKHKNKGTPRPYLRNLNVQWFRFELEDVKEMRLEDSELDEFRLREGDLLVCEGGEPGRAAIWGAKQPEMFFQKALHRLRPQGGVSPEFLAYRLRLDTWTGSLGSYFTGATIKHFTGKALKDYEFPLPPIPEQKRIVDKVDQLMALCDELEERQAKKRETVVQLNKAALNAVVAAPDPKTRRKSWKRVEDNFEVLYDRVETVAELRGAILKLAVMGRLVRQDPGDEATEVLLRRIDGERAALVAAGSARKSRHPTETINGRFTVPDSWRWAYFGRLAEHRLGKMLDKSKNSGPLRPYLRNANVRWLQFDIRDLKEMRVLDGELADVSLRVGDLVICEGGEPGRAAVWADIGRNIVIQKALHRVRPSCGVHSSYLCLYVRAWATSGYLASSFTGSTIKHLTGNALTRLEVPVPPENEQLRIVDRVSELMALCDDLESRLKQSAEDGKRLMQAVVEQLVA